MVFAMFQTQGCTNQCRGPQCVDEWPRTRLLALSLDELGKVNPVRDNRSALLEGDNDEGANWTLVYGTDALWIGQPDAGRVVRRDLQDTAETDIWTGPDNFGHGIGHVARGDGGTDLWVSAPDTDRETGALYRFPADDGGTPSSDATLKIVGDHTADRFGPGGRPVPT